MKVLKLRVADLPNYYHFQFITEVVKLTEPVATPLKIEKTFALLRKAHADEDESLRRFTKSNYTQAKIDADHGRDLLFSGFVMQVDSGLNHYNPALRTSAERLRNVIDNYGNVAVMGIKKQTAATYNLLQDLRSAKYTADVAALGLNDWVDQLEASNKEVERLDTLQTDEMAERSALNMRTARVATDRAYRNMVKHVEVQLLLENPETYADYVAKLNERIANYHDIIAQRKGQANAEEPQPGPAAPAQPTPATPSPDGGK